MKLIRFGDAGKEKPGVIIMMPGLMFQNMSLTMMKNFSRKTVFRFLKQLSVRKL